MQCEGVGNLKGFEIGGEGRSEVAVMGGSSHGFWGKGNEAGDMLDKVSLPQFYFSYPDAAIWLERKKGDWKGRDLASVV